MKLTEVIAAIQPQEVIGNPADQEVNYLLTDSRQLGSSQAPDPATTLFFALRTAKNDGAHYIPTYTSKAYACLSSILSLLSLNIGVPKELARMG